MRSKKLLRSIGRRTRPNCWTSNGCHRGAENIIDFADASRPARSASKRRVNEAASSLCGADPGLRVAASGHSGAASCHFVSASRRSAAVLTHRGVASTRFAIASVVRALASGRFASDPRRCECATGGNGEWGLGRAIRSSELGVRNGKIVNEGLWGFATRRSLPQNKEWQDARWEGKA